MRVFVNGEATPLQTPWGTARVKTSNRDGARQRIALNRVSA
ncbi:MAG: hypothetical protein ACRERD_10665 [Candidatus Binatia bacterium]